MRLRIPGGVCTPGQWLKLDALARDYANGTLRITTRQGFQLHGVLKSNLKETIAGINDCLLTTLGVGELRIRRGSEEESLRQHIEVYLRLFRALGQRGYRFEDVEVDVSHTAAVEHRLDPEMRAAVRREVRTHHGGDRDPLAARNGLAALRGGAAEVLANAPMPPPCWPALMACAEPATAFRRSLSP